jgi:tetratricopeptide (TPR) repeat protein
MEEIIRLYNDGRFKECITQLQRLMLQDDNNADMLCWLGKSYFQLARIEQKNASKHYTEAYNNFSKAIENKNDLLEAYLYRAYLVCYDCVVADKSVALQDAKNIIHFGNIESKIKGLDYQFIASYNMGNAALAIESLEKEKPLITEHYKDNQPERLKSLSLLNLQMGDIFSRLQQNEEKALQFYETGFNDYPYNTAFNEHLFSLAIKHKQYGLAGKAANSIINTIGVDNNTAFLKNIIENGSSAINNNGATDVDFIKSYLRALHNDLNLNQLEVLKLVNKWAPSFPNNLFFPKLAGNILYYEGRYAEAIPYYKKAMQLGFDPRMLVNFIISNYYATKKLLTLSIPTNDTISPLETYSAGCDLEEFKNNFHTRTKEWLQVVEMQKILYENAHHEFCKFYYYNKGLPAANHQHYFAMNCNNYGIVLGNLNKHEEAIPIFITGYQLSPFWEQLNSLSQAQFNAERYDDCISTLNKIFDQYNQTISTYHYVLYKRELITCYRHTGQFNIALDIIRELEEEQFQILEDSAHDDNVADIMKEIQIAFNEKSLIVSSTKDAKAGMRDLQKRLEEEPDNEMVYFMLFQQYHINKDYAQSVACADNYFQLIDKENVQPKDLIDYYYRRGSSLRKLRRLEEAIADLNKGLELQPGDYWCKHELGLAYYQNNQSSQFEPIGNWCIAEYQRNNFEWDDEIAEVAFALIEVYKISNSKKEIMRIVKFILEKDPKNEEAKKLKKEYGSWFAF